MSGLLNQKKQEANHRSLKKTTNTPKSKLKIYKTLKILSKKGRFGVDFLVDKRYFVIGSPGEVRTISKHIRGSVGISALSCLCSTRNIFLRFLECVRSSTHDGARENSSLLYTKILCSMWIYRVASSVDRGFGMHHYLCLSTIKYFCITNVTVFLDVLYLYVGI